MEHASRLGGNPELLKVRCFPPLPAGSEIVGAPYLPPERRRQNAAAADAPAFYRGCVRLDIAALNLHLRGPQHAAPASYDVQK